MDKKAVEMLSLNLIIKIILLLVIVFIAGSIIFNLKKQAGKGTGLTEPPCLETGKTLEETEKVLFDYFEMNIGVPEEAKRFCQSYKKCFAAHYAKYRKDCEFLA